MFLYAPWEFDAPRSDKKKEIVFKPNNGVKSYANGTTFALTEVGWFCVAGLASVEVLESKVIDDWFGHKLDAF